MTRHYWISMLERVPHELHGNLVASLNNGIEIAILRIMKIEPSFILIRGRLSGTSDSSRVFCLPYDQVSTIGFSKYPGEDKLTEIFGELIPDYQAMQRAADAAPELEETVAEDTPLPQDTPAPGPAQPSVSTSSILDRLKARRATAESQNNH